MKHGLLWTGQKQPDGQVNQDEVVGYIAIQGGSATLQSTTGAQVKMAAVVSKKTFAVGRMAHTLCHLAPTCPLLTHWRWQARAHAIAVTVAGRAFEEVLRPPSKLQSTRIPPVTKTDGIAGKS